MRGTIRRHAHEAHRHLDVSTHTPHAESDQASASRISYQSWFQPAPPMRGATKDGATSRSDCAVSTRPPCGERLRLLAVAHEIRMFQPAPPCGERPEPPMSLPNERLFQPAPPMRGATCSARCKIPLSTSFNPRPPCGERPTRSPIRSRQPSFNPRPHAGSDQTALPMGRDDHVSTRAPHAGSDCA